MELRNAHLHAQIDPKTTQLVHIAVAGIGRFHGGGKTVRAAEDKGGWSNSEIVMFPIIGPAPKMPLGQHGIARHLPFSATQVNEESVLLEQRYMKDTPVANTPGRTPARMQWPWSYTLRKEFCLDAHTLLTRIAVTNNSQEAMPYQLGWHPAFRVSEYDIVTVGNRRYTVAEIQRMPGSVVQHAGETAAVLTWIDGSMILESDLGHLMLWSPPGSKLLCIEPVTDLPNGGKCSREAGPDETHQYQIVLRFL